MKCICIFSFHFRYFSDKESFQHIDQRIQRGLYIFACTNSVMDPIVYGFFNLRKSKGSKMSQVRKVLNLKL